MNNLVRSMCVFIYSVSLFGLIIPAAVSSASDEAVIIGVVSIIPSIYVLYLLVLPWIKNIKNKLLNEERF